jgi:hypothetical protein
MEVAFQKHFKNTEKKVYGYTPGAKTHREPDAPQIITVVPKPEVVLTTKHDYKLHFFYLNKQSEPTVNTNLTRQQLLHKLQQS